MRHAFTSDRRASRGERLRALIQRAEMDLNDLERADQSDERTKAAIRRIKRNLARNKKALAEL